MRGPAHSSGFPKKETLVHADSPIACLPVRCRRTAPGRPAGRARELPLRHLPRLLRDADAGGHGTAGRRCQLVRGTLAHFAHPHKRLSRAFCAACGGTLYGTNRLGMRVLPNARCWRAAGGGLPPALRPAMHLFYRERVIEVDDALPKYLDGWDGPLYERSASDAQGTAEPAGRRTERSAARADGRRRPRGSHGR